MNAKLKTNFENLSLLKDPKQHQFIESIINVAEKCPNCNTSDYVTTSLLGKPDKFLIEVQKLTDSIFLQGWCGTGYVKFECRKCGEKFKGSTPNI